MIAKLRKRHRIIWLIIAVVLFIVFVVGVVYRHSEPLNEKIPQILSK